MRVVCMPLEHATAACAPLWSCLQLAGKAAAEGGALTEKQQQQVVADKRSVLVSMQQVLQSCYALLDSSQVPLHSIIRLLQHILRCV
jgi:hypothetical protein